MPKTLLIAPDVHNTPLAEVGRSALNPVLHTPYGVQSSDAPLAIRMGFNGQFREPQGWYCLGNGYRVYNPVLKRFHSPDRISPFGKGGINPYAYCQGDPVNHTDPTGQFIEWLGSNPLHSLGVNIALMLGNIVTTILSPVGGAALWSTRFSLLGATLGAAGASMQLGGIQAAKAVSIAGTLGSLAGASLRVGLGIQTIYDNRNLVGIQTAVSKGMRTLFLGPGKVPPGATGTPPPSLASAVAASTIRRASSSSSASSSTAPTIRAAMNEWSFASTHSQMSVPSILDGVAEPVGIRTWMSLGPWG
ncbi:RHS repeat-associated core domain-containing protein [Pseudomonas huaxiensis]|uniref:RHS repeat-associated core domain-containing protein n=1 Tax=Pseudomonas huaxiensis TaxID=2213017 RepID=UPI000DA6CC1B|nr:RHS repeat-associated core domain-containing protein [Pseudomonas huaxiensis]